MKCQYSLQLILLIFFNIVWLQATATMTVDGVVVKSEAEEQKSKPSAIKFSNSFFTDLIAKIPDKNLKEGLTEYMKMVDPSAYPSDKVGGSNRGLNGFFDERFQKNSCFRNSAINFYDDVAKVLAKNAKCPEKKVSELFKLYITKSPVFKLKNVLVFRNFYEVAAE